jgi:hypothetical protein
MFCMFLNEFCRCVAAVGDDCELKRGMSRGQWPRYVIRLVCSPTGRTA